MLCLDDGILCMHDRILQIHVDIMLCMYDDILCFARCHVVDEHWQGLFNECYMYRRVVHVNFDTDHPHVR